MSKAIDRQEIGDLIYLGVAIPWQAVPVEADPFFVPPVHIDYDPDEPAAGPTCWSWSRTTGKRSASAPRS